jgi:hypothetical protein
MNKKLLIITMFFALCGCYDDYVKDFDYNAVYFVYQTNVRTVVVGEGMKFKVGVTLAGVKENTKERIVNFHFDESLVNAETLEAMKAGLDHIKTPVSTITELKMLPSSYFNLSNDTRFIIPKGEHEGVITLKADSLAFLSDPATLYAGYVLPFRITSADADSVLETRDYAVIGLKYENMLFGNYWHGGVTVEKDASGAIVNTTNYYTTIPSPDSKAWKLTTTAPMTLAANGVSDITGTATPQMTLTLSGSEIIVKSVQGATYEVLPDGASAYNQARLLQDRKIFLNYKYLNVKGNWCYATDTLTFRNRIRDGVNEWMDENPENYK